jgi:hypothetical protein
MRVYRKERTNNYELLKHSTEGLLGLPKSEAYFAFAAFSFTRKATILLINSYGIGLFSGN